MAITDSDLAARVVADEAAASRGTNSYIDWPAIFAGVVLASAISLILLTFGSAVGLGMTSAREGQSASLFWIAIVGGLWILWVQLMASSAGAYLTGRMRRRIGDASEQESDIRDGSNGLVMWAVATLVAATLAWSGLMGAANVAGQAASTIASVASSAASDALDPSDLLIDRTLRGRPDAPAISEEGRAEIGRLLASTAASGELEASDREYLVSTISARTGLTPEEATQRVDELVARAQEIEAQAREAAEQARRASLVAAFLTAASLLIGAAAAYWSATLGGNHRDKQAVLVGWYKPW